jgi:hypothetical protein
MDRVLHFVRCTAGRQLHSRSRSGRPTYRTRRTGAILDQRTAGMQLRDWEIPMQCRDTSLKLLHLKELEFFCFMEKLSWVDRYSLAQKICFYVALREP